MPCTNSRLWNWLLLCRIASSKGPSDCSEGSSAWLPAATGWLSDGCCPANCGQEVPLTLNWHAAPSLLAPVMLDLPEAADLISRFLEHAQLQLRPCLQEGSRCQCVDLGQAVAAKH